MMKEQIQFFRKNKFVRVFLNDKSGRYYWEKQLPHPYLKGLNIIVDTNIVSINFNEIPLLTSRESSIENVKSVLSKFEVSTSKN